jgi:hypothetical protein
MFESGNAAFQPMEKARNGSIEKVITIEWHFFSRSTDFGVMMVYRNYTSAQLYNSQKKERQKKMWEKIRWI